MLQTQVIPIQLILMALLGLPLTLPLEPVAALRRVSLLVGFSSYEIYASMLTVKGVTDVGQSVFKSEDAGLTCRPFHSPKLQFSSFVRSRDQNTSQVTRKTNECIS